MKCVAPLGEITFRECSQRHRRLSPSEPNLLLVLRSPAGKEAPASSGDQDRGCSRAGKKQGEKNACDNCRSFDLSLVARIFRISRNHRCCSRGPRCGPGVTCAAFHERQNSKRLDLSNANSVESYCSVARKRPASNAVSSIPSKNKWHLGEDDALALLRQTLEGRKRDRQQTRGGTGMNGICFKLPRLFLALGSLALCVSLLATPSPQYQSTQQPAPDNTKKNRDQANPTADQLKMNPSDRAIPNKIRKAVHT